MKKHFYLITLILLASNGYAQVLNPNARPLLAPFEYHDQYGFMDTLGNEVVPLGKYNYVTQTNNFCYYLVSHKQEEENVYEFLDATNGKVLNLGLLKNTDPIFYLSDTPFYHVQHNQKSKLVSPISTKQYVFDEAYESIQYFTLKDTSRTTTAQCFIGFISYKKKKVFKLIDQNLQPLHTNYVEKVEPVSTEKVEGNYSYHINIGFCISDEPVPYQPNGEKITYKSIFFDKKGNVLGKGINAAATIKKLYGSNAQLSSNMPVYLSAGNGLIKMTGDNYSKKFNERFEVLKITEKVSSGTYRYAYYLFDNIAGDPLKVMELNEYNIYEREHFDKNVYLIRIKDIDGNGYFDPNGTVFPKGKIMIPRKYLKAKETASWLPYSF